MTTPQTLVRGFSVRDERDHLKSGAYAGSSHYPSNIVGPKFIITGGVDSWKKLQPKLQKISPLHGYMRMPAKA
jgi:hypothetical protein